MRGVGRERVLAAQVLLDDLASERAQSASSNTGSKARMDASGAPSAVVSSRMNAS
jgi:hypothetical protein